ncbi:MAG TPA: SRPBCC family protein [Candidatus Acidoferrales bacterium]|nr:SRPBCC family protein [Candidatus Acidoferrales bacterium]
MKVRLFERTQTVPRPLAETFEFFCDPHNLERLTPAFLKFRFVTTPPATVQPGTVIDYRIRLYGVPVHWRTRIETVEPPHRFVDVQEKGPYALWRHTHSFREIAGGTEMSDRVEYAMPFGPLGEIAYHLFVARSLEQIFDFRARELTAVMRR